MARLLILVAMILLPHIALGLEELEPVENLSPLPGPDPRRIGWEWHYVDIKGKPGFMRKVAGDDAIESYERSDGCSWTRTSRGFAPATVWSNCPSSGKSTVTVTSDSLWPLDIGNKITYQMKGNSSLIARAWSSKRSCEVVGAVKVKIVSGTYDTFKVICKERWGTRTWWLSPEVGTAVAYEQKTRRNGLIRQEMTKIVKP